MIARGFKSVGWVAGVGAAALGCYLLSLQVATERADLARVERQIIATKQQIRSLQTELGTRGRLTQLEQWNQDVLALAAPASGQFLQDEFTLARLDTHGSAPADSAQVRMAALDTAEHQGAATPAAPARPTPAIAAPAAQPPATQPELVHRASFTPVQSRAAVETTPPKPVKDAQVRDPAEPKLAKGKSPATTRAASIASADSPPAARNEGRRPAERALAERGSSNRTNGATDLARAVTAATSPARAATPRPTTERGSTPRSASDTSERPTAARAAPERPATSHSGATAGNKGRK